MSSALSSDLLDSAGPLVNMRQLAIHLDTTRQTISAWIDRWPDFPIVERGTNGREYRFNAATVAAYLREKQAAQARSTAARDEALAQLKLPLILDDVPATPPGLTTKERIEALKLYSLERQEAERTGQLVSAAAISDLLSTALIALNRTLHTAIRQAGRDHNLPDAVIRSLDTRIADAQRAFVASLDLTLPDVEADADAA